MPYTPEQMQNAAVIYQVGRSMGMTTRDIQIGIITAMVESNLTNVNHGDRDSLGLFQQRPSQGWGTPEQVTNPQYAAGKFFEALRGLGESRYGMGMGEAAQAVQRSAYPDRYAERIGDMRAMWPNVATTAGGKERNLDGGDYDPNVAVNIPYTGPQFGGEVTMPVTSDSVLSEAYGGMNTAMGPTAKQMLGAWGMDGPNIAPESVSSGVVPDEFLAGAMPIINPSTNTSVITPLSQTAGGFEKGVDGWRKAFIEYARTAIGQPYVWGGTNLSSGVDCSGLIYAAFQKAGMSIPRVSYQQANFGTRTSISALQPGDLVAWDNSSRNNGADHIAIYLGGGQILEAARPGTVVRVRALGDDDGAFGVKLNMR